LEEVYAIADDVQTTQLDRGLAAFDSNDWGDAVVHLTAALHDNLEELDAVDKLGFALSRTKQYPEAIRVYGFLRRKEPDEAKWPYMIGYQYYAQERWREAIQYFDRALELNPEYMMVMYRRGYALERLGNHEAAIEALMGYVNCRRNLTEAERRRHRRNYGKVCYTLGKAHLNMDQPDKAELPLLAAVRVDGEDPDRRYQLGKCYLQNGKADNAVEQLKIANDLQPNTHYIVDRLGQAYVQLGNLEEAERLYCSLPKRQRRWYVLRNLGELYLKQGRIQEAVSCLHQSARQQSHNHNTQLLLGRAYEADGQYEAAINAYQHAIHFRRRKYDKGFPEADAALGNLLGRLVDMSQLQGYELGSVTDFQESRGFGFILSMGLKVFFHVSSIVGNGMKSPSVVAFKWEEAEKGPRATEVRMVDLSAGKD